MRTLSRNVRVVLVILLAAVLVLSLWTWYDNTRTLTIRDLLDGRSFSPSSTRVLEGTITGITIYNSTYGPTVLLRLDYDETCFQGSVFGDPSVVYEFGARFQTFLHFESVTLDGVPGVWAPELACPFPWTSMSTSFDVDDRFYNRGRVLRPDRLADGWMSYRVDSIWPLGPNAYELQELFADLLVRAPASAPVVDSGPEWISRSHAVEARIPVGSLAWGDKLDHLSRLSDERSAHDRIRFNDANGNNVVDDGDSFRVRLDSVDGQNTYRTYVLTISPGEGYTLAGKYILQGPEGPYEWIRPL